MKTSVSIAAIYCKGKTFNPECHTKIDIQEFLSTPQTKSSRQGHISEVIN
jgi:hypothetical protein